MEYQSINACPKDNFVYHKEQKNATEYPKFHMSRYRDDQVTKELPRKVLCYIPIILHLKQLFRCSSLAQFMDYHACNRSWDDIIWMSADNSTSMDIEEKWPHFKEPQNLMLSLAIDDVNQYGEMRSVYSIWPIFVINNNLPPWMSIKREHIMLEMIFLCI